MPRHPDRRRHRTASLESTLRLDDGHEVTIRPIERGDAEAERRFIAELSPESRRMRFLERIAPDAVPTHCLTDSDSEHGAGFIALLGDGADAPIVGVSAFTLDASGLDAECAIVVRDDLQARGLGTELMKRLIDAARTRGVRRMYSIDSRENALMAEFAAPLGFLRSSDPEDESQVIHELRL